MELEQNRLTIEDLSRIYNQILPTIRESFSSIIYEARLSALNSQLRMNIAETALQALETHGFVLDRSGYTEDDMRAEFNAHLVCADGTEISVQVLPTEKENEELTNDLVVITTHPYLKTEHEARLRWEELNQSLHQFNLNVSPPTNVDEPVLQESGRESTEQLIQQTQIHKER
jgi:hypothetical protein